MSILSGTNTSSLSLSSSYSSSSYSGLTFSGGTVSFSGGTVSGTAITGTTGSFIWSQPIFNTSPSFLAVETFTLWGEEFSLEDSGLFFGGTPSKKVLVAQLNVLGVVYWEALKEQNIETELNDDFYNEIEKVYKQKKRTDNIDDVLSK